LEWLAVKNRADSAQDCAGLIQPASCFVLLIFRQLTPEEPGALRPWQAVTSDIAIRDGECLAGSHPMQLNASQK
jgi:hypothetical protein